MHRLPLAHAFAPGQILPEQLPAGDELTNDIHRNRAMLLTIFSVIPFHKVLPSIGRRQTRLMLRGIVGPNA